MDSQIFLPRPSTLCRNAPVTMEQCLPGSSEIGSLTAHSNEDSQFVGSSSGVYFINTVKRAFSHGLDTPGSSETDFPIAEDTLVGAEDSPQQKRRCTTILDHASSTRSGESLPHWHYDPAVAALLGTAPPLDLTKELMMMYFKVWHPLFPFLHGPTFLHSMERLYSSNPDQDTSSAAPAPDHRSTCWTVTLQCIFNLGSLLRPDLPLPPGSRIQSPGKMTSLLGKLATRHDIASLQALLAIQVYLVATMSLRLASTFGGCVLRSMMHAGLHRCPFRYAQLSSHDRQLRKRIFWCAYAIDRYLSQALGLPLGIQDSDIDVCLPAAAEIHSPRRAQESTPHLGADRTQECVRGDVRSSGELRDRSIESPVQHGLDEDKKESILASYVDSGTLTGRALELFHKSILVRSVRRNAVLYLVTDVHKWWNSLSLDLQGRSTQPELQGEIADVDRPFDFGPFFTVLYQHLILILHRPSLSLDPSTADFCSGLQTCIGAARGIIAALRLQMTSRQAFFWPGFLSAAWMSGLVLAFACQLKQYVLAKGLQEIDECSGFLRHMSGQWETARHCHMALSWLSTKIKQTESDLDRPSHPHFYAMKTPDREAYSVDHREMRNRRGRDCQNGSESRETQSPEDAPETSSRPAPQECRLELDSSPGHVQPFLPGETMFGEHLLEMDLPDPNQLPGGSSFDLNMVDLLQGPNFDSLFDIVGQNYPSF